MNLQKMIESKLESSELLNRFLDEKVEEYLQKQCLEVLGLKRCVNWGQKMQEQNPRIRKIIINVKENEHSVSQIDTLQITIAALDDKNDPIRDKGDEALSVVWFVETINKEMIDFLDGKNTKIYQL